MSFSIQLLFLGLPGANVICVEFSGLPDDKRFLLCLATCQWSSCVPSCIPVHHYTFLLHLLEVPPNHESILTLLQPQVGISAALCSQLLKSVLTSVQGRPGASLDQGVSGHMPHAQSLAAAIPEGLMAASSKSLGLSAQPTLPLPSSSRRRSLDRGGSRSVRTCRLHNGWLSTYLPAAFALVLTS